MERVDIKIRSDQRNVNYITRPRTIKSNTDKKTHTHMRTGRQKHNLWKCRCFDCRDLPQTWMNLIWYVRLYRTVSFKDCLPIQHNRKIDLKTNEPNTIFGLVTLWIQISWAWFMCICMGGSAYLRWIVHVCLCGWLDVCAVCHKYNLIMVCYSHHYYCGDCCYVARRHAHKYWARFYSLILSF